MLMCTGRAVTKEGLAPQIVRFVTEAFFTAPLNNWTGDPLSSNDSLQQQHVAFARAISFHGLNSTTAQTGIGLIQPGTDPSTPKITIMAYGTPTRYPFGLRIPHCPFCEKPKHAVSVQATVKDNYVHFRCSNIACQARSKHRMPPGIERMRYPFMDENNFTWLHGLETPMLSWLKGEVTMEGKWLTAAVAYGGDWKDNT